MSKHSLLPSHATPGAVFAVDTVRLRNGYLTSDVVGLAIRYWRSYPSYLVVCNSLPQDQRDLARSRLDSAYDAATWVLMREAYKIGLDSIALHEYGYLIKKLYLEDPRRAYYFQEDCYYWPNYIDERQDDWQSELPESEQAVLRNGEAVFTRLVLHWESAKAASPTEAPLPLKRGGHTQPDPAGVTAPALLGQSETPTSQSPNASESKEAPQRPIQGGFLGGEKLADALGIPRERRVAFFKQLERERETLLKGGCFKVRKKRPNDVQYMYRIDNPRLQDLAKRYREPKSA